MGSRPVDTTLRVWDLIKIMLPIKQFIVNRWYKWFPREMVSYWMTKESVAAKVMEAPEGHYIMQM